MVKALALLTYLLSTLVLVSMTVFARPDVIVEIVDAKPGNAKLSSDYEYEAQVTLFIEGKDGELTPSGWSTRPEDGGDGTSYTFQPAVGTLE